MTAKGLPVSPTFEELSAYLDDELDSGRTIELDQWLRTHPVAAGELARLRSMEKGLRRLVAESEKQGEQDAQDAIDQESGA